MGYLYLSFGKVWYVETVNTRKCCFSVFRLVLFCCYWAVSRAVIYAFNYGRHRLKWLKALLKATQSFLWARDGTDKENMPRISNAIY